MRKQRDNILSNRTSEFRTRGDKKLKYDWNNLFWVCAHCNNIKSDKYEPILNCTTEPVEHLIAFRKTGYFGTDEKLEFVPVKDDNVAIRNTILLLNDAYYGTTPQKKMEARIIRENVAERSFKVQRICKGVSGSRERRGKRGYCDASEEGTERQFCVYGI